MSGAPASVGVPASARRVSTQSAAAARVRLVLWLLGAAAGFAALLVVARDTDLADAGVRAALTLAVGWAFVAGGLSVWARETENLLGPLMTGLGFLWLAGVGVGELGSAFGPWLGFVAVNGAVAMFVHLLAAYPAGRLGSRRERVLVAALYADLVLLSPLWLEARGEAAPDDGTAGLRGEPFWSSLGGLPASVGLLVTAALGWVVWRRWYWATRHTRRVLTPVLATGGASLALMVAAAVVDHAFAGAARGLGWAAFVAFGAVPVAVVAGILRGRLARASVAELLRDLETAGTPGALRDALRRSLGDPTLRLAYWVSESRGYVDIRGRPFELPWEGSSQVATMVDRDGRRVAALVHDASLRDSPELLEAVTSAAGLALENERLHAELRAHVADLRESRARIVEAGDAERRRLERNLHDGAQQRLVVMALQLRMIESKLRTDPGEATALITQVSEHLSEALAELRELARGIHPAILTDRGLAPALEAVASRSAVPVQLSVRADRLPAPVEAAIYYVVSEALANVAKYAQASSVTVEVAHTDGRVVAAVADDGIGGADPGGGSGLRGLVDRVAALDGSLHVDSSPGGGTRIHVDIPCA